MKKMEKLEEKVKVTSLEIIVTGTSDKPYFEIKYKEVGKEYYNIGYSSYDLNAVFGWKEKYFEITEQYNNNFCEWKKNTTAFVKMPYYCTGCGNKRYGILVEGEYCPYCGKKIKVNEGE